MTTPESRSRDTLSDQVVIITGAAKGIGQGMALTMADAGAHIVIADMDAEGSRETAREIEKKGRRALSVVADVRRETDLDRIVDETLAHFGRIDILVNNAGINAPGGFLGVSREDLRSVFDTDLIGPFILTQRVAREMIRLGIRGRIVFISSIHSHVAAFCPHYSAAKVGVERLTTDAAIELAPYGIRVNCIRPGAIRNRPPFDRQHLDAFGTVPWEGRAGTPAEVAELALFLVSDRSSYITGETVTIDGLLSHISVGILNGREHLAKEHKQRGLPGLVWGLPPSDP